MSERELIFGRQPVLEALKSRRARKLLIVNTVRGSPMIESIRELAQSTGVTMEVMDRREVERRVRGQSHQGVLAEVDPGGAVTVERLVDVAIQKSQPALLLVLDQIQDPRNLGSLLRSAHEFGAHGVIITQRSSAGMTGVVAKASAGASQHVAVATAGNLARSIDLLASKGIWTIALDPAAKQTISECDLRSPTAIVVGSEAHGVRRLTSEKVDMRARIPTTGQIGSLNASVSGAIALYETVRQRGAG